MVCLSNAWSTLESVTCAGVHWRTTEIIGKMTGSTQDASPHYNGLGTTPQSCLSLSKTITHFGVELKKKKKTTLDTTSQPLCSL